MKPSTYFFLASFGVGVVGAVRLWNGDIDGVLFLGSALAHFIAAVIFAEEESANSGKAAQPHLHIEDAELSAALGWPGGASSPLTNRAELLKMVAQLRVRLEADARRLDSGRIAFVSRDDSGNQARVKFAGVDLRAAIDDAMKDGESND